MKKMAVSATPAKQGVSGGKITPNFPTGSGPTTSGGGRGRDQPVRHPAAAVTAMTRAGMTLAGPVAGPGLVAAGHSVDLAVAKQRPLMSFFGDIVRK